MNSDRNPWRPSDAQDQARDSFHSADILNSTFPTEIFEKIILQFGPFYPYLPMEEDGVLERRMRMSTLCSCALTCRAWLPTSRMCLYRDLTFISCEKTSFELLVESLDANPWLRTLVLGLSVLDNDEDFTPSLTQSSTAGEEISRTWALLLAGKLPNLRDLTLTLARGLGCHPYFFRSLRGFGGVTSLTLAWKGSGSFHDLLTFLVSFRYLREVMLVGFAWTPRGVRELRVPPRSRFPPLTVLAIQSDGENEPQVWQPLSHGIIQAAAETIKSLYLEETSIPYEAPELMSYRRLCCLGTLHVNVLKERSRAHPDYARLVAWVAQLEAPLEHLLLYYADFATEDGPKEFNEFLDNLVPLDIALHHSPLRELPKLTLVVMQYFDNVTALRPLLAEVLLYARTTIFRSCKTTQIQVIWGIQPDNVITAWLSQTMDGVMRTWYRAPPDLMYTPVGWESDLY
ncbi:hypothetical protein C8Q73DRAFT_710863 [Cubamyces lactineus]|nr:hypothetical protein C8Q73DRAFT_710863 [Cubamyces lactineus]